MKKKILIIVVAVIVITGGVVAALALTGGGVTEEDKKQGEETAQGVDESLENPEKIEMEAADIADTTAANLEESLGLDEEFDPAAEL